MKNIIILLCSFTIVISGFSCVEESEPDMSRMGELGIYLSKTGQLVISDRDIAGYSPKNYSLKLNKEGLDRIRSFVHWNNSFNPPIPQVGELYQQDFVLKLGSNKIYEGKLSSMVSSMMFEGIVIYDVLAILWEDGLWIEYNNLNSKSAEDPRNNRYIIEHFRKLGKLYY